LWTQHFSSMMVNVHIEQMPLTSCMMCLIAMPCPCDYFLWDYLKDHVYCTNPHTVQELHMELEAVAEEITGDMLHDTVDNFVVHLQ